jgi:transglutaminase/protease-like cytokinesis protein 3
VPIAVSQTGREINVSQTFDYHFPIHARKARLVRSSHELLLITEAGFRPKFDTDCTRSMQAKDAYTQALLVVNQIIDEDMSELERIHAIYEFVATNFIYDHYAWNLSLTAPSGSAEYISLFSMRSFFLEGFFIDNIAVCNGIAAAVSLMLAIEDIEAYRVIGRAGGQPHAWNIVRTGGSWRLLDATHAQRINLMQMSVNQNYFLFRESESNHVPYEWHLTGVFYAG